MVADVVLALLDKEDLIALVELVCEDLALFVHAELQAVQDVNHETQIRVVFKRIERVRKLKTRECQGPIHLADIGVLYEVRVVFVEDLFHLLLPI